LLVLRSLSKAWGLAGLRVGALLGGGDLLDRVEGEVLPFEAGWLVEAAFAAAAACRAEGAALVAEVCAERERLRGALAVRPTLEVATSAANFLLLRRRGWNGSALSGFLGGKGIAVRQVAELESEGWVRVTVGDPTENDAVVAVLLEAGDE